MGTDWKPSGEPCVANVRRTAGPCEDFRRRLTRCWWFSAHRPATSRTGPLRPPEPPTAGEPHPRVLDGEDRAGYWDKVRYLARLVLQPPDGTERDAYALFGNATLDQDEQGDAGKVNPDRRYGRWVVRTIRDTLRPRLLAVVGLHGKLKNSSDLRSVFEDELRGFRLSAPHSEHPLSCYRMKRLVFREWHCADPNGNRIRVVLFPQHPSRSPFNILDTWYGACQEFADRYRTVIDP